MFTVTAVSKEGRRWVIAERNTQEEAKRAIEVLVPWLRIWGGNVAGFETIEKKA